MSGFIKDLTNNIIKKFEVFERFFNNTDKNLDYKTRLDEGEVEDIAYLHTLHSYMRKKWGYTSPLYPYLQRKKALRVSLDGLGRQEMKEILKPEVTTDEERDRKSSWDRMVG